MGCEFRGTVVTTDVIDVTAYSDVQITGVISICAWFYREGLGPSNQGRVLDQVTCFEIRSEADSTLRFQSKIWTTTQGVWSIADPGSNAWHHVVVTYDNGATTNNPVIYLDGASVTVTTVTAPAGTATNTPGNLRIGNDTTGGANRAWDGFLAEEAIYNRILTAGEVKTIYRMGVPRVQGYTFYFPMYTNVSPNPNLYRNGNNGTVTGALQAKHPPIFPQFGVSNYRPPYAVAAAAATAIRDLIGRGIVAYAR